MKGIKKVLSALLATTVVFTSVVFFAGCSKKNTDVRACNVTIQKDDLWYNSKEIRLDEKADLSEYDQYYFNDPTISGDYIMAVATAYKRGESDETLLCVFDMEGELVAQSPLGNPGVDVSILAYKDTPEGLMIYYLENDYQAGKLTIYKALCDVKTAQVQTPEVLDIPLPGEGYRVSSFDEGDYIIIQYSLYDGVNNYLEIIKDDKLFAEIDLSKEIGQGDPYIYDSSMDGENIVLDCSTNNGYMSLTIDPSGKCTSSSDGSGSMLQHDTFVADDGTEYQMKYNGIYVGDDPIFTIGDSNANIYNMTYGKLLDVTEDRIIISNIIYDTTTDSGAPIIIILDKADENPNAGKTVITAASPFFGVDKVSAEGIAKFNEENKDYFIKCTCKEYPEDEAEQNRFVTDFCLDLVADDGPDIIFKPDYLGDIRYEEYFLDLGSDIELNKDEYFTNVFEATKEDGKLYYVPLAFATEGILADKSDVKEGAKGFTFEEYKDFVSTVCNGTDPVTDYYGRDDYFLACFRNMDNLWFNDGKVNLNQDAFVDLLDYCKTSIPEPVGDEAEDGIFYVDYNDIRNSAASYTMLSDASGYIWLTSSKKDPFLFGIPSSDGRGAPIQIYESVAVNSSTKVKDGCIDFIKTLLTEDVQVKCNSFPINRKACEKQIDTCIDKETKNFNDSMEAFGVDEKTLISWGYSLPSANCKENFLELLDSLSHCTLYYEESLNKLLIEEANAYFAGDRDSSELISHLENRIQTYLDENNG